MEKPDLSSTRMARTIARLEKKRIEAVADVERARRKLSTALLADADSDTPHASRDEERSALVRAQRNETEVNLALTEAKTLHAVALQHEDTEREDRQWGVMETLCKKRKALGEEIESLVAGLFKKYSELMELSAEVFNTAPRKEPGAAGELLEHPYLDGSFRLLMLKTGWGWATSWPWGPESIPSFLLKVEEGNGWAMKLRPAKSVGKPNPQTQSTNGQKTSDGATGSANAATAV